MSENYILDEDNNAIPATFDEWSKWIGKGDKSSDKRIVKQETIDGFWISTVFLGLDHSHGDPMGPDGLLHPLIFETMVFDQRTDEKNMSEDYCRRCSTWDQALQQHQDAVEKVKKGVFNEEQD